MTLHINFYTWISPDGQHQNQIDYILFIRGWGSSIQSAKQDQELTVSDHELLFAKFRFKKVGKTNIPFWYDLNLIPYVYTDSVSDKYIQGVRSDRVPEELQKEVHNTAQDAVIKIIPKKKKHKKAKWLSEEALQIAEKRREVKGKGQKESYTHLNAKFQRIAR